jgi:hypothetical protein
MIKTRLYVFALLVYCSSILCGQDSLLLKPERAGVEDLAARQQLDKILRSSIASGTELEMAQSPFSTYIISSEEILRQNISTLTDVLRVIPGVVISASGSATEGEKYLVNGLSGNAQMKVLINHVPVKAWAAGGLGIGAQLPIRQADRIEVMLGGASSFYGEEACAGVINIILEESERPVFTRTNLGFGKFGYNDLDLTFGGKLGKDKNVFRFTVYGRSAVQLDRDIFYRASELYDFKEYLLFPNIKTVWERNQNLVLNAPTDSVIAISGAPHESRQFGILLQWRGLRFRYDLMTRRDYSSIGLNPMAVSYRRPGDRIGERVETFSLNMGRTRKRRQSSLLLSTLIYSTTENSFKTHVFGAMGQTFFHTLRKDLLPTFNDKLYNRLFDGYYSNQRNVVNQGIDFRLNYRIAFSLRKGFTYASGVNTSLSIAGLYSDYHERPLFLGVLLLQDTIRSSKPFDAKISGNLIATNYHQLVYQNKRLYCLGAVSGHFVLDNAVFVQKRGAISYRLLKRLYLDGVYAEGFNPISPYYLGSTVVLTKSEDFTYQLDQSSRLATLNIQKSKNFEFGAHMHTSRFFLKASYLKMVQNQSVEGGYLESGQSDPIYQNPYILYGYRSDAGSGTALSALRFEARLDSSEFYLTLNNHLWKFAWKHAANLQLSDGVRTGISEASGARQKLNYLPNYPSWMFKYQSTLVNSKFDLTFLLHLEGNSKTNLDLYRHRYPELAQRSNRTTGRRTVDIMARVFLNKNFSAWLDVRNFFNKRYDGIDAYGTPDDLMINPQSGRVYRFGVQYNLD